MKYFFLGKQQWEWGIVKVEVEEILLYSWTAQHHAWSYLLRSGEEVINPYLLFVLGSSMPSLA